MRFASRMGKAFGTIGGTGTNDEQESSTGPSSSQHQLGFLDTLDFIDTLLHCFSIILCPSFLDAVARIRRPRVPPGPEESSERNLAKKR